MNEIKPPPLTKELYEEHQRYKFWLETGIVPEKWKTKKKWWQFWIRSEK